VFTGGRLQGFPCLKQQVSHGIRVPLLAIQTAERRISGHSGEEKRHGQTRNWHARLGNAEQPRGEVLHTQKHRQSFFVNSQRTFDSTEKQPSLIARDSCRS
jgi:hypothetical protein